MRKLRVLHLDSGPAMGGGQWQALRLHRGLLEAGHESLLLARDGSPLLEAPESGKIRPLALAQMSSRFDLVHAHDAHSHTLAALFSRVPLIVSRRVAFPVRASLLSRWKYGQPRIFLAVSECVRRELGKAGIGEERIALVYDGVPIPREAANGGAILAIDKGTGLAEEAANLAGVTIERPIDLAADLPRAKALLYLTESEGLGSAVLLAMAHGVTVIASNTGGLPELIRNGENGLLVPNNAQAIASALQNFKAESGRAARETVIARFTERHMIGATVDAYERALARA